MVAKSIFFLFLACSYFPLTIGGFTLFKALGVLLAATTLVSLTRRHSSLVVTPISTAVTVMFVAGLLGSSRSGLFNIEQLVKMLQNLVLVWIVADRSGSRTDRRLILGGLGFGAMIVVLDGLLGTGALAAEERLAGMVANANGYGQACVQALICALGLLDETRGIRRTVLSALVVVPCTAGLAYSGSRGAMISMAAAFLMVLVFTSAKRAAALTFASIVTLASLLTAQTYMQRWDTVLQPATSKSRSGLEGRLDVWGPGWQLFMGSPIVGVGTGNAKDEAGRVLGVARPQVTHSVLIQCATELGIVGSMAWLFLLWRTGHSLRWLAKRSRASMSAARSDTFLLVFFGALLAGQFFSGNYIHAIWYVLFGIALRHDWEAATAARLWARARGNTGPWVRSVPRLNAVAPRRP